MKLLICIASMEGGGAERQVAHLANGLADAGLDVYILLLRGGKNFYYLSKKIKKITVLNCAPKSLLLIFLIIREIYIIKPNIVYLWQRPFDVIGGIAALLLGIPIIYAERTDPYKIPIGIKVLLRNWVVSKSKGVIANSNQGIKYWRENSKNLKLIRVKNIIPIKAMISTLPSPETKGKFVTASRLDPSKNLEPLLRAMQLLKSKGLKADLAIIGSGAQEWELKKLVNELGLDDRVVFLGYRDDIWSLLRGSVGFISLSLYEGQPNSVLEAAFLGCPLILSDIPAHSEFKDFGNVRIVSSHSLKEITFAIEGVLINDEDQLYQVRDLKKFTENSIRSVVNAHLSLFYSI